MNLSFRLPFLVLVSLLFSGCETAPKSINPEVVQRIKRVAVVSTVGDIFTRAYIGVTVFGNEREERKVPEWRLDRTYEEQLATELRKLPNMTVIDAPYPAGAFSPVNGKGPPEWKSITAVVKAHCAANVLDGVFVITKGYGSFGMLALASRGGERRGAYLTLNASLALIDCASLAPVVERSPFTGINEKGHPLSTRMAYPESWPWSGKWEPSVYDEARTALVKFGASAWGPTVAAMMTPTK
jgi:hypothetical protein